MSARWFCALHLAWAGDACPKCDDEQIAIAEETHTYPKDTP